MRTLMRLLSAMVVAASYVAAPVAAQPAFETTRVAEGVYQFRWQSHHALLVTTPAGVVAVDPIGVDAARAMAGEIRRIAPGARLAAIVYSHSDADHATGAPALLDALGQGEAPIIAHERAVAPIRARGSADQPEPTVTFAERMSVDFGGRRIELHWVGPSHTDNLVVPFVPDAGVAFAVDFVANDRMGYRDLPGWIFPDFFGSLARLLEIPFETIVFGHGPVGDRAAVQRQMAYYDDLTAAVRRAVADGLTEDEAAERVRLPDYSEWQQYDAWFPMNVRAVHRWLTGSAGR